MTWSFLPPSFPEFHADISWFPVKEPDTNFLLPATVDQLAGFFCPSCLDTSEGLSVRLVIFARNCTDYKQLETLASILRVSQKSSHIACPAERQVGKPPLIDQGQEGGWFCMGVLPLFTIQPWSLRGSMMTNRPCLWQVSRL